MKTLQIFYTSSVGLLVVITTPVWIVPLWIWFIIKALKELWLISE